MKGPALAGGVEICLGQRDGVNVQPEDGEVGTDVVLDGADAGVVLEVDKVELAKVCVAGDGGLEGAGSDAGLGCCVAGRPEEGGDDDGWELGTSCLNIWFVLSRT